MTERSSKHALSRNWKAGTVFVAGVRKSCSQINHSRIAKQPGTTDGPHQSAISSTNAERGKYRQVFYGNRRERARGTAKERARARVKRARGWFAGERGICNATVTAAGIINESGLHFRLAHRGKSREVIEKERFCQNTGYTAEDWVEIGMRGSGAARGWRDDGGRCSRGGDGSRYISTAMRYGFS